MKKRITLIATVVILIIVSLLIYSYSAKVKKSQSENIKEIYSLVLDEVMPKNNDDILKIKEYIAVDMEGFDELTTSEKSEIIIHLQERYDLKVIDASYADLLEMGIESQNSESRGIHINISEIEKGLFKFKVHIGKVWASLGGEGVVIELGYKNGEWVILENKIEWVS